jgi:hypothetical protein
MVAGAKRIIVLSKNVAGRHHLKAGRTFVGILSDASPCHPSLSSIANSNPDVKCEEICVCCHKVLRRVSEFRRHTETHRDVGKTKATYISQMCDELRERVANELGFAERRSKKRVHEEEYTDSRTLGPQRTRLHAVDMTIMDEHGFQLANGIDPLQPVPLSTQSATVLNLSDVAEPVATGGFPHMSTEVYPESIERSTAAPDIIFDAPINSILNFPQWFGYMQAEAGDMGR